MTLPTSLFFKRANRFGIITDTNFIFFDLNLSESHNRSADATSYNVEDGSIISDHIQNSLETGNLTGYITNYPLNQDGPIQSNRAQDMFDLLEDVWKSRTTVTLYTLLKRYENVVITSFNFSKDQPREDLTAEISFKQINIVKLQEIDIEGKIKINTSTKNGKQANRKLDLGGQQGS